MRRIFPIVVLLGLMNTGYSMPKKVCDDIFFIMKHSQGTDDDKVRSDWIQRSIKVAGEYKPCDENLPDKLPARKNYPDSYVYDWPLTKDGEANAVSVGKAMATSRLSFDYAIASPALKCVQTAQAVLRGMGKNIPIVVEPGLFDYMAWYQKSKPIHWMTNEEFKEAGITVDDSYVPFWDGESLRNMNTETNDQYYKRQKATMKHIMDYVMGKQPRNFCECLIPCLPTPDNNDTQRKTVLIVGHALSLDALPRLYRGKGPRSHNSMSRISEPSVVPYSAFVKMEKNVFNDLWYLGQVVLPQGEIVSKDEAEFDLENMLNDSVGGGSTDDSGPSNWRKGQYRALPESSRESSYSEKGEETALLYSSSSPDISYKGVGARAQGDELVEEVEEVKDGEKSDEDAEARAERDEPIEEAEKLDDGEENFNKDENESDIEGVRKMSGDDAEEGPDNGEEREKTRGKGQTYVEEPDETE